MIHFFSLIKQNKYNDKKTKSKQRNNLPELLDIDFVVVISPFWVECSSDIISTVVISPFWVECGSCIIFDVVISSFWVECDSYIIFAVVISLFLVEYGSYIMLVLLSIQVILICVKLKHDLHLPKLYVLLGRFISNWNRALPAVSLSEHNRFSDLMIQILLHSSCSSCNTLGSIIIKINVL